jgi:CubicO group peptidase (beta-lactamase class C family)
MGDDLSVNGDRAELRPIDPRLHGLPHRPSPQAGPAPPAANERHGPVPPSQPTPIARAGRSVTRRWDCDPFRLGLVRAVEDAARQAMATSTAPGLAVALVHHGQVVWAAGYGLADPATGQPVTAATCSQAASLSKPVTAWGVLRLVESGRIGLDEPVIGHLRRWRPPPSPFDADGITVRRLLSHTAGLSVHGYVGQTSDRPLPPIAASLAEETGDSFPVELLEASGRGWLYSGGGYSLLQLLIEELTGRPFADYMQAEVLGPLDMTASSFQWSRTADTAPPARRRRRSPPRLRLCRAGRRRPGHHGAGPGPLPRGRPARPAWRATGMRSAEPGRGAAGADRGPRHRGPLGARLWSRAAARRRPAGLPRGRQPRLAGRPGPAAQPAGRDRGAGQRRRRQRPDRRRGPAVAGPRHAEPDTRTASHRRGHRTRLAGAARTLPVMLPRAPESSQAGRVGRESPPSWPGA